MDEVDPGGEPGEKGCLLAGRVSASNHRHRHVPVEGPVAGRTGSQPVLAILFVGQSKKAGTGSGSHNHGPCFKLLLPTVHHEGSVIHPVDPVYRPVFDAGSEFFGLLLHAEHEGRAVHPLREPRVVLNLAGRGQLPADLIPGKDDGFQVCPCRVDGGCPTGATGPDNDNVLHGSLMIKRSLRLFGGTVLPPRLDNQSQMI